MRSGGGTHEEPVPSELRTKPVLSPQTAAELTRLGVQIERLYGQPMDIEWALQDGRVFIVQARPITALPQHRPAQRNGSCQIPTARICVPASWNCCRIPCRRYSPRLGSSALSNAMVAMVEDLWCGRVYDRS